MARVEATYVAALDALDWEVFAADVDGIHCDDGYCTVLVQVTGGPIVRPGAHLGALWFAEKSPDTNAVIGIAGGFGGGVVLDEDALASPPR